MWEGGKGYQQFFSFFAGVLARVNQSINQRPARAVLIIICSDLDYCSTVLPLKHPSKRASSTTSIM